MLKWDTIGEDFNSNQYNRLRGGKSKVYIPKDPKSKILTIQPYSGGSRDIPFKDRKAALKAAQILMRFMD